MKKIFTFYILVFSIFSMAQPGFIVDHRHTNLAEIPDNWIDSAQKNLNVRYYRRSHGSQVDAGGMLALRNYSTEWAEKYNYSENNVPGALKLTTYWLCVDYDTTILYVHARQFLDDPANAAVNVMMFAWSYNFYAKNVQTYIDTMENFIRDYGKDGLYINSGKRVTPVTFVFNTACSLGDDTRNEKVFEGNKKIRKYCIDNNRILYDFNDIEQYNPDGQYFGDGDGSPSGNYVGNMRLTEDLSYLVNGQRTGNWGREWNDAHPSSELAILSLEENCEGCFHSEVQNPPLTFESRLNCVLKGRAIWYLWARLAGWQDNTSGNEIVNANESVKLKNYPNPFSKNTIIEYTLKENAMVKLVIWNSKGQIIKVLIDQEQKKGQYQIPAELDSRQGTYFYTLDLNGVRLSKKMIKL